MEIDLVIYLVAVSLFVLIAAVSDLRTGRIPNWLVVPALFLGLIFHTVQGGFAGLLNSLGGFAIGFGILFVLWLIAAGGAGDAKLMGALGAWLGSWSTLMVFFISTGFVVLGSILILVLQIARHGSGYVNERYMRGPSKMKKSKRKLSQDEVRAWRTRRRLMPYGLPVALGTWVVLAWYYPNFFV